MATIKKHWQPMAIAITGLVVACTLWLYRGQQASAVLMLQANPPYTTVTSAERDATQGVLSDVGLDREAMIALNLTSAQAEGVLAAARNWRDTNVSTLDTHNTTIAQKVTAVRALRAAERMGPFLEGRADQLATALTDLKNARDARRTTLNAMETSIKTELSPSQEATWAAMQKGFGQRLPLRMLDLTNIQRSALARSERHYKWRRAGARTDQERQAAITARDAAWQQTLTADQLNVINGLASYHASSSANVAAAYDTVLEVNDG